MDTPDPGDIAAAFALGEPRGGLVHVRRGDADVWRLDTTSGSYFVKGYLPGADQPRAAAMDFERLALEAGVTTPAPIVPADPLLGWVTRIDGRLFRAYRWIEHSTSDWDIPTWLGQTMHEIHQLQPLGPIGLPPWWRQADLATWESWRTKAGKKPWVDLYAATLPHIEGVCARIEDLSGSAPDIVTTHGDFKIHNIVMSANGPVLVDWDSVRTDSAALEAGRAAYVFGRGEPERVRTILAAYSAAGGELAWAGPDLFLSVSRNHLQVLADLIQVSLDETPAARWMGDPATIDATITEKLRDLPGGLDQLRISS
ncbi:phosphotransferase [Kribbella sp. NPDC004875]|uniref:phosphotransferase n=1 Tax=Kribbella sp. NPDC004875 TaxID=3364107 RepID=UPI0036B5C213